MLSILITSSMDNSILLLHLMLPCCFIASLLYSFAAALFPFASGHIKTQNNICGSFNPMKPETFLHHFCSASRRLALQKRATETGTCAPHPYSPSVYVSGYAPKFPHSSSKRLYIECHKLKHYRYSPRLLSFAILCCNLFLELLGSLKK